MLKNVKGFAVLGVLAIGAVVGLFIAYVGHLPR